jgi:hypothetical protein
MRKWYYSEIAIISIFIVLMLATVGGVSFWYVQEEGQQQTKIRMPRSAEQFKGENYRDVITLLETAGFRNIETVILNDLVTGWLTKDGEVERVSVNGETSFYSGSRFPVDAKIVVTYHTFPVTTTKKTDPITPQTTTKPASTPSAAERTNIESTLSSIQLGTTPYSSSSPSSQPSVLTISAPEIVKEYVDNEIAADHKYEGKIVRITAKIKDIGKDILGNPYITFSDGEEYSFRSVQCFFKKSEQAKIGTLRREQPVTIDGTVDGLMMNVLLKDCVFKD